MVTTTDQNDYKGIVQFYFIKQGQIVDLSRRVCDDVELAE